MPKWFECSVSSVNIKGKGRMEVYDIAAKPGYRQVRGRVKLSMEKQREWVITFTQFPCSASEMNQALAGLRLAGLRRRRKKWGMWWSQKKELRRWRWGQQTELGRASVSRLLANSSSHENRR